MRQAMAAAPDRKPTVERAAALRQETERLDTGLFKAQGLFEPDIGPVTASATRMVSCRVS